MTMHEVRVWVITTNAGQGRVAVRNVATSIEGRDDLAKEAMRELLSWYAPGRTVPAIDWQENQVVFHPDISAPLRRWVHSLEATVRWMVAGLEVRAIPFDLDLSDHDERLWAEWRDHGGEAGGA